MDFLVLDDLGVEIPSDFAQSVLYNLIDLRNNNGKGDRTIITQILP